MSAIKINGHEYTLWNQFVAQKQEWIGGTMVDLDPELGECEPTKITDIVLKANGAESAWFEVCGEDYACGFDVRYGGVQGGKSLTDDGLTLFRHYGGPFTIEKKKPA